MTLHVVLRGLLGRGDFSTLPVLRALVALVAGEDEFTTSAVR